MVRFEMANLPRTKNSSTTVPKVVLRVLKIVEPPNLDDADAASQIFVEGQLVQKYDLRTRTTTGTWSMRQRSEDHLITPSSKKLLWETYLKDEVVDS